MTTVLKLDQNERSDQFPSWVLPLIRGLDNQVIWQYPNRTLAEQEWSRLLNITTSQILFTHGSDEAIQLLFASLKPGTPVLIPLPAFSVYIQQPTFWPIQTHFVPPMADFTIDRETTESILKSMENGLFIITRPNNPTGEVLPRNLIKKWIQLAGKNNNRVLLDEAYADFSQDSCQDFMTQPNLLILRTLSKAYGLAGVRIGYIMGSSDEIQQLRARTMPYNLSSMAVTLAVKATDPEVQKDVASYCVSIKNNRIRLMSFFEEWKVPYLPGEANFLFLPLNINQADFVTNTLKERGILVRRFDTDLMRGVIRLSIPAQIDPLIEALEIAFAPDLICLDVDGCLVDVTQSFDRCIQETVQFFTKQKPTREAIQRMRSTSGFNNDFDLTQALIAQAGLAVDMETIQQLFETLYWGSADKPGAYEEESNIVSSETMEELRSGSALAFVTGRSRRELAPALLRPPLSDDVYCITIDDVETGKPAPEGILKAQSHFSANAVWMVGDNVDDILASKGAGAVPIGIGLCNEEALYKAGATIVLKDINAIRSLLC